MIMIMTMTLVTYRYEQEFLGKASAPMTLQSLQKIKRPGLTRSSILLKALKSLLTLTFS